MPPKDPHLVLGVVPGASADEIKVAWRRLARQHHPDLTGDDPAASSRATRRMAEINAAYASLTRGEPDEAARGTQPAARRGGAARNGHDGADTAERRRGGPPPPRATRPVTGRLDLSGTFTPRNQTTTPPGYRLPLTGQPPLRWDRRAPDLRASQPSGPTEFDRLVGHRVPEPPTLDEALDHELDFGKFHGHTLAEVAVFEPSYIDWLAGAVARSVETTACARVIRDELDRRGIRRLHRPARPGWQSNPFR